MVRRSRAFCISLAAHRHCIVIVQLYLSPSHHCRLIAIVVIDDVFIDIVVVVIVVIVTAIVLHFPIIIVAIITNLVFCIVVIAVAVVIDIIACHHCACRAPWLSIKAVSPMAWGWSASPWICRKVADGVARTTFCQRCRPVGNIMVLSPDG